MEQYKKKSIVVEAVQWLHGNAERVNSFCGDSIKCFDGPTVIIKTLEGNRVVHKFDFIIRDENGDFYPCKPYKFMNTYDPYRVEPRLTSIKKDLICNCKEEIEDWLNHDSDKPDHHTHEILDRIDLFLNS